MESQQVLKKVKKCLSQDGNYLKIMAHPTSTLAQINTSSLLIILALFLLLFSVLILVLFVIGLPQVVLFLVHFQKGGSQFMYYSKMARLLRVRYF